MSSFMKIIVSLFLTVLSLSAGVYEDLEYGDTRQQVTDKLMACERVKSSIPKTMFARVGLNGTFKIKKDLNGLDFALFFDWDENQRLKEVTLRSIAIDPGQFNSTLAKSFRSALQLISEVYGPPVMGNPMPKSSQVADGAILNSHLWHVGSGTLLMGVAKDQGKLHLSISFLEKRINPVPN
jgi:hypothetical protein